MTFRNFPNFDESNAPEGARDTLAQTKRAFGGIPLPLQRYASSPAMLTVALGALEAFEKTSLSTLEREVVAMTMGRVNGCHFCVNLHRRLLQSQQAPATLVTALEAGSPLEDRRLDALRCFVEASLQHRGDVPEATWVALREAGFSHAQALEVLMGISAYTLTTFANRLIEAQRVSRNRGGSVDVRRGQSTHDVVSRHRTRSVDIRRGQSKLIASSQLAGGFIEPSCVCGRSNFAQDIPSTCERQVSKSSLTDCTSEQGNLVSSSV